MYKSRALFSREKLPVKFLRQLVEEIKRCFTFSELVLVQSAVRMIDRNIYTLKAQFQTSRHYRTELNSRIKFGLSIGVTRRLKPLSWAH